ncbi:hypothetical protein G5V59_22465 [Nocardioides sp. W3-2-3]|uniref:hypothetical protein n=1 Tax=Nocardioides convexus TaxID=2712224 RepID=UPI0024186940|nr:hypothetical protein [Nocardioides convexus]NHA01601.1 hypothetical protein [Nocardioides convexus]
MVETVRRLVDLALAWESPEGLRALSVVGDSLTGGPETGVSGLRPRSAQPRPAAEPARGHRVAAARRPGPARPRRRRRKHREVRRRPDRAASRGRGVPRRACSSRTGSSCPRARCRPDC